MPRPKEIRVEDATPAVVWRSGTYAFDGAGNVMSLTAPIGTDQFQYDRLSRLVRGKLGTVSASADQTITFDGFGNVTQITTNGTGTSTPTSVGTNHLTTLGTKYDDAGSLTDWNGNHYSYDRLSSMTAWCGTWVGGQNPYCEPSAEQWAYVYTADDERLLALKYGEARSTWTVRDFGGSVLTRDERYPAPTEDPEWTCPGGGAWVFCDGFESGNTAAWSSTSTGRNRKVSDYVWREGQLLGSETLGEIRRHFGLDHLGTPRLVTNDFGEVLAQHTYFPFGQEATSTAQDAEPMKFTGHERDLKSTSANPADDLDMMHARYFSPLVARFMSFDFAGGTATGPQSWNRCAYVLGNPIKFVDPTGLFPCPGMPDIECHDSITVIAPDPGDALSLWIDARNYFSTREFGTGEVEHQRLDGYRFGELIPQALQGNEWAQLLLGYDPNLIGAIEPTAGPQSLVVGGLSALIARQLQTGALTVTFGHGARHLAGTEQKAEVVEQTIATEVRSAAQSASKVGEFWGRVFVGGRAIEFRAFPVSATRLNVGTYYPVN